MSEWQAVVHDGIEHIETSYKFRNFRQALALHTLIANLAEEHKHHPRLVLEWGRLTVAWATHQHPDGAGVYERDRELAGACDKLHQALAMAIQN